MRTGLPKAVCRNGAAVRKLKTAPALTLFSLAAFATLLALGFWQLERRSSKNDLIARLQHALDSPPVPFKGKTLPEFTRVDVTGRFSNDQAAKVLLPTPTGLRPRTADGFGYLLLVPLRFAGGIVFVNRGFVPQSLADSPKVAAEGEATVTGIIRRAERPAWFSPSADEKRRLFYTADLPAMAAAVGLSQQGIDLAEYIQAEPQARSTAAWPQPRDPHALLAAIPNRHLEYALTWFGLAAALALVYGFYITRP